LSALLETLQPEYLTVEMSPAALRYRQNRGNLLLGQLDSILDELAEEFGLPRAELNKHPRVTGITTLLALPFEYRAAADYGRKKATPLALIDDSAISTRKLKTVERELITRRNLRVLLGLPPTEGEQKNEGYHTAKKLMFGPFDPLHCRAYLQGRRGAEGIGDRDQSMAGKIRRLVESGKINHLVHIGGWVHLIEDPLGETLFSRLEDLKPRRLLLD